MSSVLKAQYTGNLSLAPAEAIRQLHTYRWPELWLAVRQSQPEPGAQHTPALALKAMLLAGWWQEGDMAQLCLAHYPGRVTDPLTHFALCYAK